MEMLYRLLLLSRCNDLDTSEFGSYFIELLVANGCLSNFLAYRNNASNRLKILLIGGNYFSLISDSIIKYENSYRGLSCLTALVRLEGNSLDTSSGR